MDTFTQFCPWSFIQSCPRRCNMDTLYNPVLGDLPRIYIIYKYNPVLGDVPWTLFIQFCPWWCTMVFGDVQTIAHFHTILFLGENHWKFYTILSLEVYSTRYSSIPFCPWTWSVPTTMGRLLHHSVLEDVPWTILYHSVLGGCHCTTESSTPLCPWMSIVDSSIPFCPRRCTNESSIDTMLSLEVYNWQSCPVRDQ